MATITIGAYTYTTTGSNNIIVSGPGMPRVGGDLGNLNNLSATSFLQLASSPNLTPEAKLAMQTVANSGEWTQVKAGLTTPLVTTADPSVKGDPQQTEQQNNQYAASGGANDDNPPPTTAEAANIEARANNVNVSTNTNPNVNSGATPESTTIPGRRLYNPLTQFSSFTYNISLYMVTPEAYDAFIQTGRRNINALGNLEADAAGVYLIAQSGGINNQTSKRAPGFEFDYYIDNLKIVGHTPKSNGTSVNTSEISFNIMEPYGFSFITNLKRAQDALQQYVASTGRSQKGLQNPARQFFILGVRFYGYDKFGNVLTRNDAGETLDTGDDNGMYETFYDIVLTEIKFKITGKMINYSIKAQSLPSKEAFGVKRGLIDTGANLEASTAYDAIELLMQRLSTEQEKLVGKGISKPDVYTVQYLGDMEERLKSASIVSPADLDKYKWASSGAKSTKEVNDSTSARAAPNSTKRTITIQGTTPILQAINQIISQSSYLEEALKVVYTTAVEPDPQKQDENEVKPNTKNTVRWYNLSSQISRAEWDEERADFALNITYIISPYETPVIQNAYSNPGVKYYGPHKRYEYYYTGQNTEILNYEQNLNCAYFNVALNPNVSGGEGKGGATDIPLKPNQRTPMPRLGRSGDGAEAQNSYLTQLFDPTAFAMAKITILGDPDYLWQDSEATDDIQVVYNQFYGPNGYTIKANGGQVFIEIDFKEAIDYDNNTGVMDINESILFWKYPGSIAKIVKGVSYQIVKVESSFSAGKFTQVLHCTVNTFGDVQDDPGTGREEVSNQSEAESRRLGLSNSSTGSGASGTGTTTSTGLLPEQDLGSFNQEIASTTNLNERLPTQPPPET